MTRDERRAMTAARAALLSQQANCNCWGEREHRPSCHRGKAERAVLLLDQAIAADARQMTLPLGQTGS